MAFKLQVVRHVEKKEEVLELPKTEKVIILKQKSPVKKAAVKTTKKIVSNIIKKEHKIVEAIVAKEVLIIKKKRASRVSKKIVN